MLMCSTKKIHSMFFKYSECFFKGKIRREISLPYRMAKSTKFLGQLFDTLKAEVLPPHLGTQRSLYAGTWHTASDHLGLFQWCQPKPCVIKKLILK